jgi:hypothetical protein
VENLRLFTNLEQRPVIEIPVLASVDGILKMSPSIVSFGSVSPGESKEVIVTVEAPDAHAIRITSVKSSIPDVKIELNTVREGHAYELRCSISSATDLGPGQFRGTLTMETDDPVEVTRELVLLGFMRE